MRPKFCGTCGDSLDDLNAFRGVASEESEDTANQQSHSIASHLGLDITVEVEAGSVVNDAGQLISKGIKRTRATDFRSGASSIASMPKQT